jgi:hypothetical protein
MASPRTDNDNFPHADPVELTPALLVREWIVLMSSLAVRSCLTMTKAGSEYLGYSSAPCSSSRSAFYSSAPAPPTPVSRAAGGPKVPREQRRKFRPHPFRKPRTELFWSANG